MWLRKRERKASSGAGHFDSDQGAVIQGGGVGFRMHLLKETSDKTRILQRVFDIEGTQLNRSRDATPYFNEGGIGGLQSGHPVDDDPDQVA